MADEYDVIIIGTGAGGGTLAHTLAPSGKRILLLERGDFLPRDGQLEPDAVFIDGKYISADTWYDSAGAPFQPPASSLYLAGQDRPSPLGNIQMIGKSNAGAMKGGARETN